MEAVIDQALGDVQGVHAFARLTFVGENDLVHRRGVERFFVICLQTVRDVTRVQHRGLSCFAQTVVPVGKRVSQGAQHHAVVSEKSFDAADRLWVVEVESVSR